MNFLKKFFDAFSKMSSSRKYDKLVEALNQKPKLKEEPVQDIEDLIKKQYPSPVQTRSRKKKQTQIKVVSSLTTANIKLKPIPFLKTKSLVNTDRNLNAKLKPRDQRSLQDVRPGMFAVAKITQQRDTTSQTNILSLKTIPTERTMLTEFYNHTNEIDNKFRQSFDSKYGKSVPLTLVPSSESSNVGNVNTTIDAKKAKSVIPIELAHIANDSAVNKSTESTTRSAGEKSPKAKSNRKTKSLVVSKEKVEAIKKKETVPKKKSTKKNPKEESKTEMEEDKSSSKEHVALESVLAKNVMPVPPKPVESSKKALKEHAAQESALGQNHMLVPPKPVESSKKALKEHVAQESVLGQNDMPVPPKPVESSKKALKEHVALESALGQNDMPVPPKPVESSKKALKEHAALESALGPNHMPVPPKPVESSKKALKEHAALVSVLGQNLMPVPPKPAESSKKALKLVPFLFNPHKIDKNCKELNTEHNVIEIKEESKRKRASPLKLKELSDSEPETKLKKWQPEKWTEALENIKQMRTFQEAPVDQMGCQKCFDENADEKTKRFQILVALMLSSQTRDQITYEVMHRLRENTCTPASIVRMKPEKLMEILHPVSFYKNKTKYLQTTAKILIEKHNSDIPKNIKELLNLPGVGPKMAHICMRVAWDLVTGIGVDTHVHRISNRLGWVKNATKDPEQTRKQLELWLPPQHWQDVNYLLVGFGQTLCTPVRPKCHQCLNNAFCPSANITKTPPKREVKIGKQDGS